MLYALLPMIFGSADSFVLAFLGPILLLALTYCGFKKGKKAVLI